MRDALIFLTAIPALAQFSGLSTTTDGSRLYFSSPMQLTGSADMSSDAKIIRYAERVAYSTASDAVK